MVYAEAPWTFKGRSALIAAVFVPVPDLLNVWINFLPFSCPAGRCISCSWSRQMRCVHVWVAASAACPATVHLMPLTTTVKLHA